jgi:Stage II sporulation protein E (SpoIIE)
VNSGPTSRLSITPDQPTVIRFWCYKLAYPSPILTVGSVFSHSRPVFGSVFQLAVLIFYPPQNPDLMRFPFQSRVEAPVFRQPAPCIPPKMQSSELAAQYRAARVGGDFFEFVPVGNDRMVFVLLDIAGQREEALHIAAAVQDTMRSSVPQLFHASDLNESNAITDLVLSLNHTILEAAEGVRCAPGFVGCYNESMGIISYVNAGSVPALMKSEGAITVLEAGGLPLGLFSHATHDAQVCVLGEGSSLLLASRGLLEVKAGGEEYGITRLKESFQQADDANANALCFSVLKHVSEFVEQNKRRKFFGRAGQNGTDGDSLGDNDVTTVALLRSAARTNAASAR